MPKRNRPTLTQGFRPWLHFAIPGNPLERDEAWMSDRDDSEPDRPLKHDGERGKIPYERAVANAAMHAISCASPEPWPKPKGTPIRVEIRVYLPRPKSAKRDELVPAKRPRVATIEEAVLDGLAVHLFEDRAQVVSKLCEKRFDDGRGPRVVVDIDVGVAVEVEEPKGEAA